MGVITALEVQKKNKQRVNVYIDGEFAFGLNLLEAAGLRKGQTLTETEIAALRDEDAIVKAVDRAARFLATRPRSIYEVRHNLEQKDETPAVIEAAVNRLTQMGYLDDVAFAKYWVQNRNEFKPLSPRALRFELRKKGVPPAIISEVLDELEADDLAYRAAQRRTNRLRGMQHREFRNKMAAFLQQRGFPYSTIRDVVERLIEELEAQDPEYFKTDEE